MIGNQGSLLKCIEKIEFNCFHVDLDPESFEIPMNVRNAK
jgi:hypothetical protein